MSPESLPDRSGTRWVSHQTAHAALDELDYRNQRGRFPIEQVKDALGVAFPLMLRDFLYSDDARDVTGSWGFTTTQGNELREQLMALMDADSATPDESQRGMETGDGQP